MVNKSLLAGEKDYPEKLQRVTHRIKGKTTGIIVARELAVILTSKLQVSIRLVV